jgi:predicted ATP-grasp superfamily ATP-dependent carboligase
MNAAKILVVGVNAVGMIGVLRSLGRAGYETFAIAEKKDALGLFSTYAKHVSCCPSMGSSEFIPWLRLYIEEHEIEAIIPSEGFLHAISGDYHEFSHLLPDAVSLDVWQRCLSKVATQQTITENLSETSWHLPVAGIVRGKASMPVEHELTAYTGPFYVKADAGLSKGAKDAHVIRCESFAEMVDAIEHLLPGYDAILWQHYVPGRKVGVSLWRHNGEIIAQNMTLGIHMQPWNGGMMSLRESFWHEQLLIDAIEKMETLGWQGVAMMEYKWDPVTDEFWFIEINARYWGYLHLDLLSGKDFPKLQTDAFFGEVKKDLECPPIHVICRHTVPGEIGYMLSKLKSDDVNVYRKMITIFGFFLRFFDLRVKSDLLFPGDRGLYFRAWRNFIKNLFL